jgi:hypothetical protein
MGIFVSWRKAEIGKAKSKKTPHLQAFQSLIRKS